MHRKNEKIEISVVQNFICDLPARLKVLQNNTPKIGKVWGDYDFFVNFNSLKNNEKVHKIYSQHIPKLNFYNNLEKDWAGITLSMVNEIKTPYVIFINEDQQFNMTKNEWDGIIDECFIKNDVDDNGVERTKWVEKYEFKVEKFNLPDKKELGNVGNWGKKAENSYTKNNASPSSLPF